MKHVIEFTLRRRFLNTTAIILNVVIFLGMGVLCHIDLILSDNKEKVYVGESEISEALLNSDEMYTQNEEEAGYVLYYEKAGSWSAGDKKIRKLFIKWKMTSVPSFPNTC